MLQVLHMLTLIVQLQATAAAHTSTREEHRDQYSLEPNTATRLHICLMLAGCMPLAQQVTQLQGQKQIPTN